MFRQYLYLISAALMSVASACTSTTPDEPQGGNKLPVAFRARADINSRATTDSENITDNPFAVWGSYVKHNTSDTPVAVFNGTEVGYENDSWTYQDTQYWIPGMDYIFSALHPASSGATSIVHDINNGISFDYVVNQEIDLLGVTTDTKYCQGTIPMGPVELNFRHLQSRVQFVVKRAPNLSPAVGITVSSASFSGVYTTGRYTLTTDDIRCNVQGSLSGAVAEASSVSVPSEANKAVDLFNYVFVLPVNVPVGDSGANLSMTYYYSDSPGDSRTYSCKLADVTSAWEAGKTYRYTIEIGANDYILFSKPEVIPWEESGGTNIIIQGDQTA